MHKDGFNEDKFKEGLGECVKMIKKTRERKEKLVNLVVPLLSQKTKREIVESWKSCYVILKIQFLMTNISSKATSKVPYSILIRMFII